MVSLIICLLQHYVESHDCSSVWSESSASSSAASSVHNNLKHTCQLHHWVLSSDCPSSAWQIFTFCNNSNLSALEQTISQSLCFLSSFNCRKFNEGMSINILMNNKCNCVNTLWVTKKPYQLV